MKSTLNTLKSVLAGLSVLTISFSQMVFSLSSEHEAQRLLIDTEQAFAKNQLELAESNLEQVKRLGIALPIDYQFLNGKLLVIKKRYVDARYQLESYVEQTGSEGSYYREALTLLTEIENNSKVSTQKSSPKTNYKIDASSISLAEDPSKYVGHLQQLYKTDDAEQALTRHVNSLLRFYAYGDDRIIASSRIGTPSRHQLVSSNNGELISLNKIGSSENIPYVENRFSVYGINPYINYQCFQSTSNCWLLHPITSDRWIQIVNNRDAAEEITKALSRLIINMQKQG